MSDSSAPPTRAVDSRSPPFVATSSFDEGNLDRSEPRVRRRNRIIKSCLECRRRKLKCDKVQPCANCVKVSRQCHFIAPGSDPAARAKLAKVKEKIGILERGLEADLAHQHRNEPPCSEDDEDDDIHNLDPTQLTVDDAAYYEDEDADDDIVDLGVAMGKVRITERIGGLIRPRVSEEFSYTLKEISEQNTKTSNAISDELEDWMLPSQDFVAPSSSFMFAPGVERMSIMHYLPSKMMVDKLVAHYWQAVHIIARTVHRPSFERQYARFWDEITAGIEPRASFQAVVLAALLSSVISMSEDRIQQEFGVSRQSLIDSFRQGTESALSRANLLRTTKLETLQAFVMYLIPLCRAEVSRAHSALTGTCIRLAECMGLHRDPSAYSISPIECQVRRLVWHQICFLDIRTCEATGPRPQIRLDDYDTRFPTNIDDLDLDSAEKGEEGFVVQDKTHFTDMTITRMRFECYEMHRLMWSERLKLGAKAKEGERPITITSVLSRIQSFRARMEKTYLPMLSKSVPLHVVASEFYGISSDRLYLHILQRYLYSDKYSMPDRLHQITIGASIRILEHSMNIEQQPALSIWSWYTGALHQYHASLLLVNETCITTLDPELHRRIWNCLDFVFELSGTIPDAEKTQTILRDLVGKLEIYTHMRRLRAPKDMPQVGPRFHAGQQSQQKEGVEARERQGLSEPLQSTRSSNENPARQQTSYPRHQAPPPPPLLPQQQQHQQQQYHPSTNSPRHTIPFPGAMPQSDWGTFHIPVSNPTLQHTPAVGVPITSTVQTDNWMSSAPLPGSLPGFNHSQGSGIPSNVNSTTPSSQMDPLGDVDWNEIDLLFAGAQTGSGNMLSPPFTFPPFAATDLQQTRAGLQ